MADVLAIVGSKCALFADVAPIVRCVIKQYQPRAIVSGGCSGVDLYAETIAKLEFQLPVIECQPAAGKWEFYKPRDLLIAKLCTRLVRIVSVRSRSYGSGWTRDRAAEMGKPVEEYEVD